MRKLSMLIIVLCGLLLNGCQSQDLEPAKEQPSGMSGLYIFEVEQ